MRKFSLRALSLALCALLLLLPLASLAGGLEVQIAKNDLSKNESLSKDVRNILLLLYDGSNGNYGASETMMVASINNKTGDAKMAILQPRLMVPVPQAGEFRLMEAYRLGGENLALKTVNEVYGLNVSDFMAFDMNQFSTVIEMVGDINLTLDDTEGAALGLSAGSHALNAEQALTLMRLPSENPEVDRQYRVFRQALSQGTKNLNPLGLTSLATKLMSSMHTNIGVFDLVGVVNKVLGGGNQAEDRVPAPSALTAVNANGELAYTADLEAAKAAMLAFLYP